MRGPGGGYIMAYSAEEMRISDIIMAVDEPISATRCTAASPSGCMQNKARCITHDLWSELTNHIHLYLSSVSVADVCDRKILGSSGVFHMENAKAGRV